MLKNWTIFTVSNLKSDKLMGFSLGLIIQFVAIVAGVLGIACSLYCIFKYFSVGGLILSIFTIIFCLIIIAVEVYIFEFFKYFAFILTFWGKGIMFLFMGFFIFSRDGFQLTCAIIFWVLFIIYVISFFIAKSSTKPLMQKEGPPQFTFSSSDVYSTTNSSNNNKDSEYYNENPEN